MKTTLIWGNEHSLDLEDTPNGTIAELHLIKENGRQNPDPVTLPRNIFVETVLDWWGEQKKNWEDLLRFEGELFVAPRVIWLPGGALMWNTFHLHKTPYDTIGFVPLLKETWRKHSPKGTIWVQQQIL